MKFRLVTGLSAVSSVPFGAPAHAAALRTLAAMVAAGALGATTAWADAQTSGQQRCLNKVPGSARKVASSTLKTATECIRSGWAGDLPGSAQDCLTADLKGRIAGARTKVADTSTKSCGGLSFPDFGYTNATATSDAFENEARSLVPDCFDADLDAALAGPLAADEGARCSSGAFGQAPKLLDSMLRAYLDCVKAGLRAGTVVDEVGLDACLDSILTDTRGKVAKSVARVKKKLLSSACPATPADYFPGMDGVGEICDRYGLALPLDADRLATCIERRTRCRACRTINEAQGLSRNCDQFDDGSVDATCPGCPNGMIDAGEECDDGNGTDGDGCTAECIDEFCGDEVINDGGAEECDDGTTLNSDSNPNACRTDCTLPTCGDGVVDDAFGEQCDEGAVSTATCDSDCTLPSCGDGLLNGAAGEACDDGNASNSDACVGACVVATCGDGFVRTGTEDCDGGECCTGTCDFATAGSACTGVPGSCLTPQCDGAGSCGQSPVPDGTACDDGSVCTGSSECQSGVCTGTGYTGVGAACEWMAVASDDFDAVLLTNDLANVSGADLCGFRANFGVGTVIDGSVATTKATGSTPVIIFGLNTNIDTGDVVTNNSAVATPVITTMLPGLAQSSLGAGQVQVKTPNPTFYDTTGSDPRVARCAAAQAGFAATKAALEALPMTADLGTLLRDINTMGATRTVNAVNVGDVNVFDLNFLNGSGSNVTINLDGGGSADTVFVFRIGTRFNTGENWTFNLLNGLTADHVLFYVSRVNGDEHCALGIGNVGGGTLFCPDVWLNVNANTVWSGAFYGGGGSAGFNGQLRLGGDTLLTYEPFSVSLP